MTSVTVGTAGAGTTTAAGAGARENGITTFRLGRAGAGAVGWDGGWGETREKPITVFHLMAGAAGATGRGGAGEGAGVGATAGAGGAGTAGVDFVAAAETLVVGVAAEGRGEEVFRMILGAGEGRGGRDRGVEGRGRGAEGVAGPAGLELVGV